VAIKMQQVEREIGEPLWAPFADGIAQPIEMRDATVIGDRDLTVQNHRRQCGTERRPEGLPEYPGPVIPIAAEQLELAVTRKDGD
jgi:hypothetical protein